MIFIAMRSLALILFLLPLMTFGQSRDLLSFELRADINNMEATESLPIYLRGEVTKIMHYVRSSSGTLKGVVGNIVSCELSAAAIASLSENDFITYVEYSHSRPEVLNDVMITNNNIHPVHQGVFPLPAAYHGEDVIIGIIDTGVELAHPDFQHADGSTRVLALWDQTQDETIAFRVPQPYNYGQEWNGEDIDAGISNHGDQPQYFGHGSNVAGIATGNANATGDFVGVAPDADIIIVSSDFTRPNWKSSIAEAVEFIFAKAEAIGKPVVINASLGDYYGSHDALDAPALYIDSLLDAAPGRAMVAAAGNSDQFPKYHLSYAIPEADTAFTWFTYNANSSLGYGAVFFELWADVDDFENAQFTIGADLNTPAYAFRGYAGWRNAAANLNVIIKDTIFYQGQKLGIVESWCGQRGDQYHIQMVLTQPFSTQYNWRFATTGGGSFDCWSYSTAGTSGIVSTNLPSAATYPEMSKYREPDKAKTIVDSWTCSEKVITVGNYVNRSEFVNVLGTITTHPYAAGSISVNTSRGPTRDNRQKPDIAASGDVTLSAGRLATLANLINTNPGKVAEGGMHYSNGGTSMASPVVAGVAALYFSRCPSSTYADIKTAMQENAIADQFTGPLPGNQMGWGKLDAWAVISSTVNPVAVEVPNGGICPGAEMILTADEGYVDYSWNNGISGQNLSITGAGNYQVNADDSDGCRQKSALISIVELEAPDVPEILFSNEMFSAAGNAFSWQWYIDGAAVEGASGNSFPAAEFGVYQVLATGENGCSTISAPYFYGVTGIADEQGDDLLLFPNPARDYVEISGLTEKVQNLTVFDVSGRIIGSDLPINSTNDKFRISLESLSSGMYIIQLQYVDGSESNIRLVVEK